MRAARPNRGAALAAFCACAAAAWAQPELGAAQARPRLVDVHHHFYPPALLEVMQAWQDRHRLPALQPNLRGWTPARTLADMDATGTATAFLALASPRGVWFDVEAAAVPRLSRTCNEYAANLVRGRPDRFGFFASLPMPDVDASLRELAYALDTLRADGIGLPTSFGDRWPGEAAFAPLYAELDRRKTLVVLHPYAPNCCGALIPGVGESLLEYPYDTGRAVLSLLTGGVLARYRGIRWVIPHGGGPLPSLAGRIATFLRDARNADTFAPEGIDAELRRLYYDTANVAYGPSMSALLALVAPSQLLFGTDFPYLTGEQNLRGLEALRLPAPTFAAIARDNALRLLPRLRS
jgi:predicted TIM-barrel fold metal-dependent hydrolase